MVRGKINLNRVTIELKIEVTIEDLDESKMSI